MALMVTGVGFLIHIYSAGYMGEEPDADYARYFGYLNYSRQSGSPTDCTFSAT